jgi:hypothetical protein
MERAVGARNALADDARGLADEDRHGSSYSEGRVVSHGA